MSLSGWIQCAYITRANSPSNYQRLKNCPSQAGIKWQLEDSSGVCATNADDWVDWEYQNDNAQKSLGYYLDSFFRNGIISPAVPDDPTGCGIKSPSTWKLTKSVSATMSSGTIRVYYKL